MKYVVLLVVLIIAYASWRSKRIKKAAPPASHRRLSAPQEMLACATCGVHVPKGDALLSGGKSYCCVAHQQQNER